MSPSRKIITGITMYHKRADNFNNLKEYTKDLYIVNFRFNTYHGLK